MLRGLGVPSCILIRLLICCPFICLFVLLFVEFFELLGVARSDSSANFLRSWCYPYALVLHTMLPYCTPRRTGDLKYKKNLPDAGGTVIMEAVLSG